MFLIARVNVIMAIFITSIVSPIELYVDIGTCVETTIS